MNPVTHWPTDENDPTIELDAIPDKPLLEAINQYLITVKVYDSLNHLIEPLYLPMARWLLQQRNKEQPLLIGINGAQGSGKSTLAGLLQVIFARGYGLNIGRLSIDDLYFDKKTRAKLATKVHPLLKTRGVPGTHDIDLGLNLINKLLSRHSDNIDIPRFDKLTDNPVPLTDWDTVTTPLDIILLEGWFVGSKPQSSDQLREPINELETSQDADAIWRTYVNEQLAGKYQVLFNKINVLLMLKVPAMQQVLEWRGLQEKQLSESSNKDLNNGMSQQELEYFLMHYERLTQHQLETVPKHADAVLSLNDQHQIASIKINRPLPDSPTQ